MSSALEGDNHACGFSGGAVDTAQTKNGTPHTLPDGTIKALRSYV